MEVGRINEKVSWMNDKRWQINIGIRRINVKIGRIYACPALINIKI